ncbi:hypothetical protein CsatB_012181 [Cannabis sativa]|uniref:Uncharacterized protein n=1 Tax=Cannabis sativa TaxID=3483 RepID=A0A7J6HS05_CANSA|nr:uncharacterized protein LOC115708094 [Cannabis sativa]KAF4398064.1 hypothetical protein G4B88_019785 [Cannabis sativa]
MANVNSSIESEPRTLKEEQLNLAREVAADAVQKLEPHEATIIFIERMTPVGGSIQKMKQISEKEDEVGRVLKETREIIEIPCQCTCTCTPTTIIRTESVEQNKLREPLSSPF